MQHSVGEFAQLEECNKSSVPFVIVVWGIPQRVLPRRAKRLRVWSVSAFYLFLSVLCICFLLYML